MWVSLLLIYPKGVGLDKVRKVFGKGASLPSHGGDLSFAEKHFGRPASQWLDLSTGISPWPWIPPDIPNKIFHQLPGDNQDLLVAASKYYQCELQYLCPVPGSQWAIQSIPLQVKPSKVAIPIVGFKEHQQAWQSAGHVVEHYEDYDGLQALLKEGEVEHAVVINPNNPSAQRWGVAKIQALCAAMTPEAVLVLDEAFMDTFPDHSILRATQTLEDYPGLIVLRSLGKFFGLAGLRLGFVASANPIKTRLETKLGLWSINHPAQYMGHLAMLDEPWQLRQKGKIMEQASLLMEMMRRYFSAQSLGNGGLFVTVQEDAAYLFEFWYACAKNGIWLRYDNTLKHHWLRIGLPEDLNALERKLPVHV